MIKKDWQRDLLLLTLFIGLFFLLFLGTRHLSVPDEARYAEIPREMLELNDFITPHLNYVRYFEKPILFYWMQSASIKLFGFNTWALRLPTALMGLLGCLLTYLAAYRLFDRRTAFLGSIILATNLLYFGLAHLITLDMTLTFMLSGCLFSFILAIQHPPNNKGRNQLFYAAYVFAALATLTKGLIGLLLPGFVIFLWLLFSNRWRDLKHARILPGILLYLIIVVPWHMLVEYKDPGFLQYYILDQQILRYLTPLSGRYQPLWFFIPTLAIGFFPWIVFLPPAFKFAFKQKSSVHLFLLIWAVSIFAFFSLSHSKLVTYILPIFPALALLVASYLSQHWQNKKTPKGIKTGTLLLIVINLCIAALLPQLTHYSLFSNPENSHMILYFLSATLIIASFSTYHAFKWNNLKFTVANISLSSSILLIILLLSAPRLYDRSIQRFLPEIISRLKPNEEIIIYKDYYQDLPVYLKHRVTVVDYGNEFNFGTQWPITKKWFINTANLLKRWHSHHRILMLSSAKDYAQLRQHTKLKAVILAKSQNPIDDRILISNMPDSPSDYAQ